jgi:hypothetical protein
VGVKLATRPALCAGRCALNRSVPRNSESPCSVRSGVAAGSQAGVKRAAHWAIHAVGFNSGLIYRSIGNSLFSLVVAGSAIMEPLLLSFEKLPDEAEQVFD